MKCVKQLRRALAVEITLDQIDASRGGRGLETETWMHDLRDGRESKATEEESKAYSLPEDVPNEKLFSKEEIEEQGISLRRGFLTR